MEMPHPLVPIDALTYCDLMKYKCGDDHSVGTGFALRNWAVVAA